MMQQIADRIPHEYRVKILFEWLPGAKAHMSDPKFVNLWEAYFIYIDPDAVKKTECPKCLANVRENWRKLAPYLEKAEKEYNLLNAL